ncbi:MAG: hypothetical protein ACE5J2_06475 [Nitrososphaerales archaeon]
MQMVKSNANKSTQCVTGECHHCVYSWCICECHTRAECDEFDYYNSPYADPESSM